MNNNKKTLLIAFALFLITLVIGFGAGYWAHGQIYPTQAHFPVLSEAYQIIQKHGYPDIPEAPAMEYGAVHGMVNAYQDPHTHFIEPVQTELKHDTLSGSYGGIVSLKRSFKMRT